MFGIPGKQAVTITDKAAAQIARLMAKQGSAGLRIGVKKGGCAGMEYTMEFADTVAAHEEVIEQGDARVLVAPMAQMFLFGTEIDYQTGLLESGFQFKNPNVSEACGCGESIKFDDVETLQARMDAARAAE
jgi:iron-sulfur cluster assembly protein